MKPINISAQRVNVGIGDFLYMLGLAKLYFVQEVRYNRREISTGAITEETTVAVSGTGGWARGELPGRIIRITGLGINDTTGNGRMTDFKVGNKSLFSEKNVASVVLDTNTCGESGGATAIGQLRWGALPIDIWIWDDQTISAIVNVATGTVTFALDFDVQEFHCKELIVESLKDKTPDNVVIGSRLGSNRVSWNTFLRLQSWL